MELAMIDSGVVINCIIADSLLTVGDIVYDLPFDTVVRIDQLDPKPSIGWTYDGNNFAPPS